MLPQFLKQSRMHQNFGGGQLFHPGLLFVSFVPNSEKLFLYKMIIQWTLVQQG
jgi:hypothetical protein